MICWDSGETTFFRPVAGPIAVLLAHWRLKVRIAVELWSFIALEEVEWTVSRLVGRRECC